MGSFFSSFLAFISEANNIQKTSSDPLKKSNDNSLARVPKEILHEFIWKYGGKEVFLAGSFNNWEPIIQMKACDHRYHKALVRLDPAKEWQFKFIVDGVWRCSLDFPTITDSNGNTNNIIRPNKISFDSDSQ